MALRLAIDQYEFPRLDYGYNVGFKIYDEDQTAFDATGYTGTAKFYKRSTDMFHFFRDVERATRVQGQIATVINDISVTWDTQASGIGHFAFTESARPSVVGPLWIEIQLTTASAKRSTELKRVFVSASDST